MGSKYVVLVNTFPIDTGYIVFVVCNATNKYEDLGFLISHDTQVLLVTQFNTLLHYWKQIEDVLEVVMLCWRRLDCV